VIEAPTSSEDVRVAAAPDPTFADKTATVRGEVPLIDVQSMVKSTRITVVLEAASLVS
jgi:hypothetical protein